jgi:hypothetical protein
VAFLVWYLFNRNRALTGNIKQKLLVFERRILRRIFGPTQKADGEWRLKKMRNWKTQLNMKI